MKLLDYINEKTNNAYKDFKLVSVIFDENNLDCTFKFLYKDIIKENDKKNLHRIISEYINTPQVNIVIKCKKSYVDNDLVRDVIYNFIYRNYASVCVGFEKSQISVNVDDNINVIIKCNDFQYEHLTSDEIKNELLNYADGFFFEKFNLNIEKNEKVKENYFVDNSLIDSLTTDFEEESKMKYVKVKNIKNIIGEVVGCPVQMSCIEGEMNNIEIVGEIKFLNERSFESKRKDKNGENVTKVYYNFNLSDKTSRMNCVVFPNKTDLPKVSNLQEGMTIIVHGDVEEFNGRTNFKCKNIASCEIVEEDVEEENIVIKKEPNERYITVNPEPYVELMQDNLFAEKPDVGQYVMDNDVVVFDIETTGLDALRCEILEIGAVKIHKGRISETFETLINPKCEIPDEIINLTGITPELVSDAPTFKQVIFDFYKFCYGTTIIAYNIDFDYKFISLHSKKYGLVFDMRQIDAMYLARAFIPGLKNFKLSTVCKKLDVSLENAHRAVHDAMATAEVVLKLGKYIK